MIFAAADTDPTAGSKFYYDTRCRCLLVKGDFCVGLRLGSFRMISLQDLTEKPVKMCKNKLVDYLWWGQM
jgi:hypothetical protein